MYFVGIELAFIFGIDNFANELKIATDRTEDSTEAAQEVSEITAEAEAAVPRTFGHATELVLQLLLAEAVAEGKCTAYFTEYRHGHVIDTPLRSQTKSITQGNFMSVRSHVCVH